MTAGGTGTSSASASEPRAAEGAGRVLYVVGCASPPVVDLPDFLAALAADGWRPCAILTPSALAFLDEPALERLRATTGHPVRSTYKRPEDPDVLPPADAFMVAPATFNTVNKLAAGAGDTLALGLLNEGLGAGLPIVLVPWSNRRLACHPAYARSISFLRAAGAHLVMTDRNEPRDRPRPADRDSATDDDGDDEPFPWARARAAIGRACAA